jgi:hypothetical protein
MRPQTLRGRREFATLAPPAELRVGDLAAVAEGIAEVQPGARGMVELSGGLSSPSMSRPLSVNHSAPSTGFQSKPTLFLTPRAKISRPEPSPFMRRMDAWGSPGSQMLQGAPTGT